MVRRLRINSDVGERCGSSTPWTAAAAQRIRSRLNTAPAAAEEPAPFSMNGLTRDRVEAAVVRSGGQIADVLPSLSGGHHWDGYRYFVSKPPG